jgi:CRISPR-associated protein Csd1
MLKEIAAYAMRQFPDMEAGFGPIQARWRISISGTGGVAIEPYGGEHGAVLAHCPEYPDNLLQGGGKSNFLVDTLQVMLLYLDKKDSPEKFSAKHEYFVGLLRKAMEEDEIAQLAGAVEFFSDSRRLANARAQLTSNGASPTDKAFFVVNEFNPLTDSRCSQWWAEFRRKLLTGDKKCTNEMVCLLSGEPTIPLLSHPQISGLKVVGGRGQDRVVACDKDAFKSFGLDQGENGAMSETMANAYAKGLDDLIAHHAKTLAGAKVTHWFKAQVVQEEDPLEWLNGFESQEQKEAAAQAAARRLLSAIRNGERTDLGNNHYYALTLSGAKGRVMVREWMEGSFEDLLQNIEAWFGDLAVTKWDGQGLAFDPKFNEVCLALVRNDRSKSISENPKQLPAPTAATLWKVAVQCLPIPQPIMAQALARFRSDLVKDEPFNHARMGLIKAYFVRLKPGGDPTMTAYLNPDHPSAAYHCGRLLAVLANLQREALGNVGAGVVQRYYAAVSQTPGLILGRLISNARNHLGKLDEGRANWYEERIAEVMSRLKDNPPRILDLEGQGLFALGYYQQLAALRAGNKNNATESITQQGETQ